ncbi:hypothetical protein [Asticcacaulis sp. EMRT-3]|uniref:hypothetical protein n=1 Tax=Asticcacaulis sp. EMRT-3 TaxID=3040349 RepID=UPI0024AF1CE7|nr:hypothetical protein [Asticcacaulis sp. EMRT-3]MDI7775660.1 hypothetical protein [Asticcacaulis sp. EMRT-3]
MPEHGTPSLDSYRRDAVRLLKAMRGDDELRHAEAMQRFARLASRRTPDRMQLKHALAVIATEAGYDNWTSLKLACEGVDFSDIFAAPGLKDSLNAWFAGYDEARTHHQQAGGVLLPYRHQVFVTSMAILPRLGYEPDDPDWRAIGYDFVRPASTDAHARIRAALTRRFVQRPN